MRLSAEERERLSIEAKVKVLSEEREKIRAEERSKLLIEQKEREDSHEQGSGKGHQKSVCIWEQNIDAYLEYTGKVHNEDRIETRQFDRQLVLVAKNNVLHVKGRDINIAFDIGVVVTQPHIKPQHRNTECEQVSHIIEHTVYLDFGDGRSVRITVGSFIIAYGNTVVLVSPPDCGNNVEETHKSLESKNLDNFACATDPVLVEVSKQ